MIIAIDGTAASGKGTLAKRLAAALDFAHLDTGALYRAAAYRLISADGSRDDENAAARAALEIDAAALGSEALRSEEVGQLASAVARLPAVRAALLDWQRRFAETPPDGKAGAVLDGRDIGTVVCPDADVKFFVDAAVEVRARRRQRELGQRGSAADYEQILADLVKRDAQDRGRTVAPLEPARDAHLLDTTDLDIEAALARALTIVERVKSNRAGAKRPN